MTLNWVQATPTQAPPGRAYAAMSYDSLHSRTVLFGGSSSPSSNLADTWVWDGINWTQRTPSTSPPGLVGAAMVYDSARSRSVLFGGGLTAGLAPPATWEWDGNTWTQRSLAVSPPARLWHAMAFDSARGVTVLFGGNGGGTDLGDTWVFDGIAWTHLTPATSPSPRFGHAMAFDSVRNRVVLFGGRSNGVRMADTWEWDGSNWTQVSTSSAPSARFWHSMAFDSQRGKTRIFGGDHVAPFSLGPVNDTWEWDGANWTQDVTAAAPSPRAGHSMAYDSGRGKSIVFGGTDEGFPGVFYNDTWELGTSGDNDLGLAGLPANITTNATSPSGAVVTYTSPSAIDEAGDNPAATVACAPASGSTFAIGTTTVTCTATDADDTPSTVSQRFTVTVLDTDLAMTGLPADITTNATSQSGAVVTYTSPSAIDEAGDNPAATVACAPASGSTFAIGTTTVTCTATDADDTPSTVSQSFTITVLDTDLAITGMPGDITTNATSSSGAVVTYATPTAVDEAGDNPAATVACAPAAGSTFAISTTTVTCTATDADDSPSTASQSFTVTVLDTDLAITGMPADITTNATSPSGSVLAYASPTAVDEAGDNPAATVACTPASGSTFAIGTTTVTCTATDADDTPSTVSQGFSVTVLDTDLAITGMPANITTTATGASGAVVNYAAPTAVDESGDSSAPTVSCSPASGSTFAVGTTTVTCTAGSSDDSPATVPATFTVTVLVDLHVAVSVAPTTATTGTKVIGTISLTNDSAVSRTVTLVETFSFLSPTGQTITLTSSSMTIHLAPGQTVTRSVSFKVTRDLTRGTYSFAATASDVTGSTSAAATFNVT
jgi:HYR domain/Galactose oxidase, central domain